MNEERLEAWVLWLFDRQDPEWYWRSDRNASPLKQVGPEGEAEYTWRLLRQGRQLAKQFSPQQIGWGFSVVASPAMGDFARSLGMLEEKRQAAAATDLVALYRDCFDPLCGDRQRRRWDEWASDGSMPLDAAVFMLWDSPLAILGSGPVGTPATNATLDALAAILRSRTAACVMSALHALGHYADDHGRAVADIIDDALQDPACKRWPVWIRLYAEQAKVGHVQ